MSYYSLVKLRGATGQSLFAFDFPYLKREDVRVFVDGTAVSFTFTSPNTIELVNPLTKASDVVIRRFTETGRRLVDYNSVAELTEEVLDMDSLQAFYIVQEALDTAASAVVADIQGNWDAKNGRIINVADPIDDTDAMNRRTFFELNGAYTSKMEDWLRQAREAVNAAVDEANRARDEANRAADIQELTQAIHDGTVEIKAEAEKLLTLTVEERIKAEAAVVASKEWADKSAYWYDVFRSIYLGLRSEHPGGEVVNGAVYFNTTDNRLYFYTGSQWYSPTTDADRAEAARRFVESMRNEVSNMRDQTQVYSQQAQDFVTDAQDAANAAGMSAGTARNEAAAAANHAKDAEISAGVANERASAADGSAKLADAAAGRAEAAAAQVGETFGDRGGWYVAHGMPTKPMRSSLWTVMDGGELDGVEWNVGDMLVYSIKTNSFGRITGASITPSEPAPIEAEEGLILGDGKSIRAKVSANIRWIAHANSEGVKLGDNAVELHLLGNNMVFGALKHPVFHKGNLPSWDDVTGKPETFPVGVHTHKWDEITGKPAAALRWPTWFEVTDKPTYFPPVTHGHSWNEITNKPDTALRWPTLAEVGAAPAGFGLGTEGKSLADKSCNDAMESGFYSIYSSTTDTPYGSGPSGSGMMVVRWGGGAGCFQLFFAYTAARIHARRRYQDKWLDWFELYSTSKKPTPADIGAVASDLVSLSGEFGKIPRMSSAGVLEVGRYLDFHYESAKGDNNGRLELSMNSDGTSYTLNATGMNFNASRELYENGKRVYSENNKPSWGDLSDKPVSFPPSKHSHTAADVGALPATGGNLTGKVQFIGVTDAGGLGRYALDLNNHNVGGLNALVFNDPSDAGGEGIFFPKTGKNDGSTSMADYDVLTALDGKMTFNGKKVYHEGDKPAWDDIQNKPTALPPAEHGHAWSELTGIPVYAQRWPTVSEVGAFPSTGGRVAGSVEIDTDHAAPLRLRRGSQVGIQFTYGSSSAYLGVDVGGFLRFGPNLDHSANGYVYTTAKKPTPGEIGAAALNHGHARQFGSEQSLSTEDLDTIKTPGVYAQHANANTSAARHYPENLAGSLIVTAGAGVQQRYHVYNTSRVYTRAQYTTGAWTPWAREYNTLNKPTAADVGALPVQGAGGVLEVGKYIDFHDAGTNVDYSLRLMQEGTSLRVQGANGYVDVGAKNTGYAHYYTDRPQHYFDKNVNVNDLYVRSDVRLKSNLEPLSDALAKVCSLKGWTYDKKLALDSEAVYRRETGLIAQDVQKVLPSAVHAVEGDLLTLSSSALVALLVEAVKELSEKVKELEHGRT